MNRGFKQFEPAVKVLITEPDDRTVPLWRSSCISSGSQQNRRPKVRHPVEVERPVVHVGFEHRSKSVITADSSVEFDNYGVNQVFRYGLNVGVRRLDPLHDR